MMIMKIIKRLIIKNRMKNYMFNKVYIWVLLLLIFLLFSLNKIVIEDLTIMNKLVLIDNNINLKSNLDNNIIFLNENLNKSDNKDLTNNLNYFNNLNRNKLKLYNEKIIYLLTKKKFNKEDSILVNKIQFNDVYLNLSLLNNKLDLIENENLFKNCSPQFSKFMLKYYETGINEMEKYYDLKEKNLQMEINFSKDTDINMREHNIFMSINHNNWLLRLYINQLKNLINEKCNICVIDNLISIKIYSIDVEKDIIYNEIIELMGNILIIIINQKILIDEINNIINIKEIVYCNEEIKKFNDLLRDSFINNIYTDNYYKNNINIYVYELLKKQNFLMSINSNSINSILISTGMFSNKKIIS